MKKTFCTLSDYSYLNRGLALYDSLVAHCPYDFELYYLCVDRKAFDKLKELKLKNLIPVDVWDVSSLSNVFNLSRRDYSWSLASRFMQYLCNKFKHIEEIMYIDSDIVFYPGMENIYDEIGTRSIGIIPHLHITVGSGPGGYNVGIIYFKNNKKGKMCLDFWVDCVMGRRKEWEDPYGNCGDQKYLELFEIIFPADNYVIGSETSHGAPWNLHLYNYNRFSLEDKKVLYKGKERPLVFCHFAGFEPDYKNDTYAATRERFNEEFLNKPACRQLYDEYYKLMKDAFNKYLT